MPIPPIFMRQAIDVATKKTYREIIDGQQRLRAITEFVDNKFSISKSHNEEFGGMYYKDLDEDVQEQFLDYDLFVEVISEKDDTVIYDMFARLNTNNCVLNRQEIRNSKFWGDLKSLHTIRLQNIVIFFTITKFLPTNSFLEWMMLN